MKENDREQELTARKVAKKIAKERPRPRARTLNNVVNWIESGLVKGGETIPNNAGVRASESLKKKNWYTRKIESEDWRTSCVEMCSRARRVACFHQVTNKRNLTCLACLEDSQKSKYSWKKSLIRWSIETICSVQSSQFLLEVLAIGSTLKWADIFW